MDQFDQEKSLGSFVVTNNSAQFIHFYVVVRKYGSPGSLVHGITTRVLGGMQTSTCSVHQSNQMSVTNQTVFNTYSNVPRKSNSQLTVTDFEPRRVVSKFDRLIDRRRTWYYEVAGTTGICIRVCSCHHWITSRCPPGTSHLDGLTCKYWLLKVLMWVNPCLKIN